MRVKDRYKKLSAELLHRYHSRSADPVASFPTVRSPGTHVNPGAYYEHAFVAI
jgi:hypothetical protein